jgi:hypothetical protein
LHLQCDLPGIKSEKQSDDAILDTSLASQAYISNFAFTCNLYRSTLRKWNAAGNHPPKQQKWKPCPKKVNDGTKHIKDAFKDAGLRGRAACSVA